MSFDMVAVKKVDEQVLFGWGSNCISDDVYDKIDPKCTFGGDAIYLGRGGYLGRRIFYVPRRDEVWEFPDDAEEPWDHDTLNPSKDPMEIFELDREYFRVRKLFENGRVPTYLELAEALE